MNKSLPTFEGDIFEWPCFKRTFKETSKRGGFNEEENLMRLYQSLKGTARETVASLMVTTRDTKQIMDLLNLRFGNPNAIATRIIEDIENLPKLFNNGDLVVFATRVRNCVSALEAAHHIGYLHSPDLVKEITQKLCYAMAYNYNRYLNEKGEPGEPALVTLSRFLFYEAEIACKAGTIGTISGGSSRKQDRNLSEKDRNPKSFTRKNLCITQG